VLLDTLSSVAASNCWLIRKTLHVEGFVHIPLSNPCPLSQPSQTLPWCIAPDSPYHGHPILTESQQPQFTPAISFPLSQSNVQLHQEMLPLLYQLSKYLQSPRLTLGPPWLSPVHQYCSMLWKMLTTLISASSLPIQHTNLLCRWCGKDGMSTWGEFEGWSKIWGRFTIPKGTRTHEGGSGRKERKGVVWGSGHASGKRGQVIRFWVAYCIW